MTQAHLVLADGTIYTGTAFGAVSTSLGELNGVTLTGKPITTFVGGRQVL